MATLPAPMLKNRLSRLMGERRVSIKEVAEQTGLAYKTVFDLYHEKSTRVDLGTVNKLCNYFRVPTQDLLEWTPESDE